ncbi:MAG: transglutaminase family protein [Planctomycetota bacterium]
MAASVALCGCGPSWPEYDPRAHLRDRQEARGRSAGDLEEMLALPGSEIDVGRAALLIAAELRAGVDVDAEMGVLDRLAADAARRIGSGGTAREAVEELNAMLLGGRGVGYYRARTGRDFDVTDVIANRRGNCLSCAMLYLAVADRLGLRVHAVSAPGHVFLRYDDGVRRFNIEPTLAGRAVTDLHYRKTLGVSERAEALGLYLRSLSGREFLAEVLAARGGYFARSGRGTEARRDLRLALSVLPNSPQALANSGYLAEREGRVEEALTLYRRVLVLDPHSTAALNNLAGLLVARPSGREYAPEEAGKLITAALRYARRAPRETRASLLDTAGRVAAVRGLWRDAAKYAARAARLAPDREDYRRRAEEYARRAAESAGAGAGAEGGGR